MLCLSMQYEYLYTIFKVIFIGLSMSLLSASVNLLWV